MKMQYHLHNCKDKILQLLLDEPTPTRHKTLYWAAPPISFYSNQCLLLRAVRRIIISPPEKLENRSDQILLLLLLLLLSRHLLVSFTLTTLGSLTLLRLLQRQKANDLELQHCIFSRRKCLTLSPSYSKTLNKWCRSTIY